MGLEVFSRILETLPPPGGCATPPAVALVGGSCHHDDSQELVAAGRYLQREGVEADVIVRTDGEDTYKSLVHGTRAQIAEDPSGSKMLSFPTEDLIERLRGFESDLVQSRQGNLHEIFINFWSSIACEKKLRENNVAQCKIMVLQIILLIFESEEFHSERVATEMRATYNCCSVYTPTAYPGFGGWMVECPETTSL